jgi:hypothetical protein
MEIDFAIKQFDENLKLYGNAQVDPEKYNLYAGLLNQAKAVKDLQTRVVSLEDQLNG